LRARGAFRQGLGDRQRGHRPRSVVVGAIEDLVAFGVPVHSDVIVMSADRDVFFFQNWIGAFDHADHILRYCPIDLRVDIEAGLLAGAEVETLAQRALARLLPDRLIIELLAIENRFDHLFRGVDDWNVGAALPWPLQPYARRVQRESVTILPEG